MCFQSFLKGDIFSHFFLASLDGENLKFPRGSTLKEKNLLLEEQILSFKS